MAVEPKGDPIATSAEDGKQGDGAVVYGNARGSASGSASGSVWQYVGIDKNEKE